MEQLKLLLYNLFANEVLNMNIGYTLNARNVQKMMDIINIIDYVEGGYSSTEEILNILQMYDE